MGQYTELVQEAKVSGSDLSKARKISSRIMKHWPFMPGDIVRLNKSSASYIAGAHTYQNDGLFVIMSKHEKSPAYVLANVDSGGSFSWTPAEDLELVERHKM